MHCLALPYLAYITIDLNPADWATSVAQLAEHWTSNPGGHGFKPRPRQLSVFFHCLPSDFAFPCLICMYMCEIDDVASEVQNVLHLSQNTAGGVLKLDDLHVVPETMGMGETRLHSTHDAFQEKESNPLLSAC